VSEDDWRITNQDAYLRNRTLRWTVWRAPRVEWDHDHCEFCWAEISDRPVDDHTKYNEAWVTEDGKNWIRQPCFVDFRERFGWKVAADEPDA
jgi:hypothetical protein